MVERGRRHKQGRFWEKSSAAEIGGVGLANGSRSRTVFCDHHSSSSSSSLLSIVFHHRDSRPTPPKRKNEA